MTHSYDKRLMARAHAAKSILRRGADPLDTLAAVVWPRPEAVDTYASTANAMEGGDMDSTAVIIRQDPEAKEDFASLTSWGWYLTDDDRIGLFPKDGNGTIVTDADPYVEFLDEKVAMRFVQELQTSAHQLRDLRTGVAQKRA